MWGIGIRFLTGTCVATDVSDREAAEWPPHPMRLFMAMAAAYFETAGDSDQREALEWFEALPTPTIHASPAHQRTPVTTFVPVNDGKGAESLVSVRSRQPRTFPTVVPVSECIYYVWPDEEISRQHRGGLEKVLTNVSRVGHSSSMVQAWIVDNEEQLQGRDLEIWASDEDAISGRPMRRIYPQALAQLEVAYNEEAIDRFVDLGDRAVAAKGKAKKELRQQMDELFGGVLPVSQRPEPRLTARFRKLTDKKQKVVESVFDNQIFVLTQFDGPMLGSESTFQATSALRGAILSQFDSEEGTPQWISGHNPDGTPSLETHLAILPLPYVDAKHADGHLLGLGIAMPRTVSVQQRGKGLSRLLTDQSTGEEIPIHLRLGKLGEVTLRVEKRSIAPIALQPETWSRASRLWATATPIVLDRFPKTHRDNRAEWNEEVREIIALACNRMGLPKPLDVAISHNAFMPGVPKAHPRGGGFPTFPNRSGSGERFMVHAMIEFDEAVEGPVLLGAGRYLGYGLCKPFKPEETRRGTTSH